MDWKSLYNNVLSNIVWWLLVLGGGALLALLKIYWPKFADPTLYALVGIACLAMVAFSLKGKGLLISNPAVITPENIEEHVREWLDHFRVSSKKESAPTGMSFLVIATLRSGNLVAIGRHNEAEEYLSLQSRVMLGPEHQVAIDAMTEEQRNQTIQEIVLELLRTRIAHTLEGPPFRAMILSKGLRISGTLTEDVFIAAMDEMDNAGNMAKLATNAAFARNAALVLNIKPAKSAKPLERGRPR